MTTTSTEVTCKVCGVSKVPGFCQDVTADKRPINEAGRALASGVPIAGVHSLLRELGYPEQLAQSAVSHAGNAEQDEQVDGQKMAVIGLAMIAFGIIATIISYTSAAPGGTYTIWWGLIVVGVIQLFRGLSKAD